jgi:hypothetical protein
MAKRKSTKWHNDLQNTTQKTNDISPMNSTKNKGWTQVLSLFDPFLLDIALSDYPFGFINLFLRVY